MAIPLDRNPTSSIVTLKKSAWAMPIALSKSPIALAT